MFVKEVSVPRKNGPAVKYVQIVESVRESGRRSPKHTVVLNLGRSDRVDRPRVSKLIELLNRFVGGASATLPQGVEIGQSRELGIMHLAEQLWKSFDLERFFRKCLRARKIVFPVERAILAMAAHRLQEPTSKLQDFHWIRDEAFSCWGSKVELQHLYRALDFLHEYHEELEDALYAHRRDLLNRSASMVFFDTTSVHFEMAEDPEEPVVEGLRQYGRPKDGRISHRQILIGMAVDPDGLPLLTQTFRGNTADSKTVVPVIARLKKLGVDRAVFVADRGMVSRKNLEQISGAGLDYIVGLRLRRAGAAIGQVLADTSPYEQVKEGLQAKRVKLGGGREVVICYSPQSAERDLKLRGRALERLNERLAEYEATASSKLRNEILAHDMFRRWVREEGASKLMVVREKVAAEAKCDGTFVLEASNPRLSVSEVALGYKSLLRVEQAWQSLKHILDIQPVFLRTDDRIEAHVMVCMLSYLLERWAELKTGLSFAEIRRTLRSLHATELVDSHGVVWRSGSLSPQQARIYQALDLVPPKKVLHAGAIARLPQNEM